MSQLAKMLFLTYSFSQKGARDEHVLGGVASICLS